MNNRNFRVKLIGNGLVKILVLVGNKKIEYWTSFFEGNLKKFDNLQILLAEKENGGVVYELFEQDKSNPFIFILDLSDDGFVLEGYGDRYRGISEKVFGRERGIVRLNEEYARWFSTQTEFSVIKIGLNRKDLNSLIYKILAYFNGK